MKDIQLVGTAFEYAEISTQSGRIADEIQNLLPLLTMYKIEPASINQLNDTIQLLKVIHFSHTFSGFQKKYLSHDANN